MGATVTRLPFRYRLSERSDLLLDFIRQANGAPLLLDGDRARMIAFVEVVRHAFVGTLTEEDRARMIAFVEVVRHEGGTLTEARIDAVVERDLTEAAERLVRRGVFVRVDPPCSFGGAGDC